MKIHGFPLVNHFIPSNEIAMQETINMFSLKISLKKDVQNPSKIYIYITSTKIFKSDIELVNNINQFKFIDKNDVRGRAPSGYFPVDLIKYLKEEYESK